MVKRQTSKPRKTGVIAGVACKHLSPSDCSLHPHCNWVKEFEKTMKKSGKVIKLPAHCATQSRLVGDVGTGYKRTHPKSPKLSVAGRTVKQTGGKWKRALPYDMYKAAERYLDEVDPHFKNLRGKKKRYNEIERLVLDRWHRLTPQARIKIDSYYDEIKNLPLK